MKSEDRPPLLEGPPTPQDLEEVFHVLIRNYPELRRGVVSTNSMGSRLVLRIRAGFVTQIRELVAALGDVDVQLMGKETSDEKQLLLPFGPEEEPEGERRLQCT